MPICYIKPVIDLDVRKLCCRPYSKHPKGCPNYGKRDTCPPKAPILADVFDLNKTVWAIWVEFDLAHHRDLMRRKHPNWSRRQLDCCLYWQGTVNKDLRCAVANFCTEQLLFGLGEKLDAFYCPEAMGVNVTATMQNAGIDLEWPPEKTVIKIAFVGVPNEI